MAEKIGAFKTEMNRKGIWWKIVLSILLLGLVSFLFSHYPQEQGATWYHQLKQPVFAPPYWLPFVMWSLVYVLMGSSIGIIWHYAVKSPVIHLQKQAKLGIKLFLIHLIFNLIYPFILVGLHWPMLGLVDFGILILLIGALIFQFRKVDKTAANLLIPYLLWILYATALNVAIIVLN